MVVQVNNIVAVLCELLDCCCPVQPSGNYNFFILNSISLVRNDKILHKAVVSKFIVSLAWPHQV